MLFHTLCGDKVLVPFMYFISLIEKRNEESVKAQLQKDFFSLYISSPIVYNTNKYFHEDL